MRSVASIELSCTEPLPDSVRQSAEPILLRGYVAHWPAVIQCRDLSSTQDYLRSFWNDAPLTVYVGDESIDGRFFYNSAADGFNFLSGKATLAQVFDRLADNKRDPSFHTIYVGSTPVDEWLPGFRQVNDINLQRPDALVSFWLGSPTTVSAHFDFPDNIACVVAGRRTFTLFPPEQLENLYVGPIDRTPSGQAISLVDHRNPDFNRHPKYAQALEHAI